MKRILFSNIGYAKGIDGTLLQHLRGFHRHFYMPRNAQEKVLGQIKALIATEGPDICCFVEIDQGSYHSTNLNQMHFLRDEHYAHFDIADKYGDKSLWGRLPLYKGKSNGFLSRHDVKFERLYLTVGMKRLVHRIHLPNGVMLYSCHFSLQEKTRRRQFIELRQMIDTHLDRAIIMADFNILKGFSELKPLLEGTGLCVLNREEETTFIFHRRRHVLDLCLAPEALKDKLRLRIVPQPYSDHAALLLDLDDMQ